MDIKKSFLTDEEKRFLFASVEKIFRAHEDEVKCDIEHHVSAIILNNEIVNEARKYLTNRYWTNVEEKILKNDEWHRQVRRGIIPKEDVPERNLSEEIAEKIEKLENENKIESEDEE